MKWSAQNVAKALPKSFRITKSSFLVGICKHLQKRTCNFPWQLHFNVNYDLTTTAVNYAGRQRDCIYKEDLACELFRIPRQLGQMHQNAAHLRPYTSDCNWLPKELISTATKLSSAQKKNFNHNQNCWKPQTESLFFLLVHNMTHPY